MSVKVPDSWLPNVGVHACVLHWTGGARTVSTLDKRHYHIIIPESCVPVRGVCSIADNVNLKDGSYAAHTRGFNARNGKAVIGVSLCGMAGATQSPFRAGGHPITQEQWEALADVTAQLAKHYRIPVDEKHILQHGEVQRNLGIPQKGKWDICALPWAPVKTPSVVCSEFREMVRSRLDTPQIEPEEKSWMVVAGTTVLTDTATIGGSVYVPARWWSEILGLTLGWDKVKRTVSLNGIEVPRQVTILDGVGMLPLRLLCEFTASQFEKFEVLALDVDGANRKITVVKGS